MLIFGDRTAKLADLGLSRLFRPGPGGVMAVDRELVTLWSRAPELLMGAATCTPAVDAWAAGCGPRLLLTNRGPSLSSPSMSLLSCPVLSSASSHFLSVCLSVCLSV